MQLLPNWKLFSISEEGASLFVLMINNYISKTIQHNFNIKINICTANQLTGSYMKATLVFNGLIQQN